MDPMRHAWLARSLIDACGGLPASADVCRLAKSRLSEFTIPTSGAYMPADVIADLEAYCGRPIYSQALVEARPGYSENAGLLVEVCETTEQAAELQRLVRQMAGRPLDRRSREQLLADADILEGHLRAIRATATATEPAA